ncbi:hypothetical protein GT037_008374 [Alternaria burnsii]|uniref:Uncharacterized protein n=1 Tax=Alternaria burnsii TaxID=1187904 RepID=A0A8H7B6M4_9PLEO|nr:uncharacterized protein GT037_008374 [Alternaria burnsii]KAF7673759.1 hypothetical protein GT037_008374 [Alternaria burnsii]
MSSSQGLSFEFRFGQPDATNTPKPRFMPKPLRPRKQRGQDYDPSLTANMGPPDMNTLAESFNTITQQQHPSTEEKGVSEAYSRKINCQLIKEHIQDICTFFDPTDQMSNLNADALAASWEIRLWDVSFGHTDRVSAYIKSVDAADKDLTKWITHWESAEDDSSDERTGRQFFVDHIEKYHAHQLQYTTHTGSLSKPVSTEDEHRQALRRLLADELETMKAILPMSHPLSSFDIAQVVHKWEGENWIAACEQVFNVFEHVEHTEGECETLHLWAEYRNGYPDEDINMTGEARFSDFIRQRLETGVSGTSTQHDDRQETRRSIDESYTSDNDSDIGSEDEYEDEEEGYATKKAYLKDCVAKYLPYYTNNPDNIIDRWQEKLLLQAREKGGGFDNYKESLYDDLDTVETCRDSWDMVVQNTGKTGHSLFSELIEECSEEAIAELRNRVKQKEEQCRHERLLNSEEFNESLDVQDQKRREHRTTLRTLIDDAKTNMGSSHELSDIQLTTLAAHWETRLWTDESDYYKYLDKLDHFEMDLMEWTTNWQLLHENDMTGEQNFIGYAHRNPDRSVLRCELRCALDSISGKLLPEDPLAGFFTRTVAETREEDIWVIAEESMVEQIRLVREECTMLYRWCKHWTNVCDQDLTGEENFRQYYGQHLGTDCLPDRSPGDHGLDSQTADELFDLAGGNDTASNDSEDDARGSGLSDEFLEDENQELVSPRSPNYDDSGDDDDAGASISCDTEDQSGNQSAGPSVPHGCSSLPSSQSQAAESVEETEPMQIDDPAHQQDTDISQKTLVSANQPSVGNNTSTSGVATAAVTYPGSLPIAPSPDSKASHVQDDTAMDGVSYHLLSQEVEMSDNDSNLTVQKEAVDTMPAGGLATNPAARMKDTEMSGADFSQTWKDISERSEPLIMVSTGNPAGPFDTCATASNQFWSTPQTSNRPALPIKNESTSHGSIFDTKGLSFQAPTTTSITPPGVAMSEPDVPRTTPQCPLLLAQTVEGKLDEPLITPVEVGCKTVFPNVSQDDVETDGKAHVAKKPKSAEAKTTLLAPAVLAAPQATSAFTFKPPKGSFVPTLPSGFDAGSWSGGFDFNPPAEDDITRAVSSSGEVKSIPKTTQNQEPVVDESIDHAGADNSDDAFGSALIEVNVDPTSDAEETGKESLVAQNESPSTKNLLDVMCTRLAKLAGFASQAAEVDAMNAEADERERTELLQSTVEDGEGKFEEKPEKESEDCSNQIRKISLAVRACDDYWLDANSSDNAPPAFVKVAEGLRTIAAQITDEGDWSSPSALSKIEALSAKWQAFIDTIKAFINITTYFHPDYDYRFERSAEQYRSDVEMVSEYETLSRLPGAPDLWRREANKRRDSRDNKTKSIKNEIHKMRDLYQGYYDTLEALQVNIDSEAMKKFADETLVDFHAKIVRVTEAFDLHYMGFLSTLQPAQMRRRC